MSETIGFIGTGNMGAPMARNLLRAGFKLRIWNRTPEKARALAAEGAELVQTPAQTAAPGGIVITMLADDRAVEEAAFGSEGFGPGLGAGVHLSMSTIAPATAARLAARHRERGASYVAAPVFGLPPAAAARKLWICTAGALAAKTRTRPVLEALGQEVIDFGEQPGAANVVKLAGNFMIMAAVEAMAEAFTVGEKHGIPPAALADLFGRTLFACPVYQNYGRVIAEGDYAPPRFRLELGLKDASLALDAGRAAGAPMPLAALLQQRMVSGVARGRGGLDWAALALGARDDAGLG